MTDRQLVRFARSFRAGILDGRPSRMMCAAVCYPLQTLLELQGVASTTVTINLPDVNHVFLRLADGRILDPTADQFGLPAVYLGPMPLEYDARQARLVGAEGDHD